MKKNSVLKIGIICFSAALLIGLIVIQNPKLAGLLTLPTQKEALQQQETGQEKISTALSFEVVKPTELDVNALKAEIEQCPRYISLVFDVTNSGNSTAERLFAEPSSNLKVLVCLNCSARALKPKEKIQVSLKACKINEEESYIAFYSINAEEKRIRI